MVNDCKSEVGVHAEGIYSTNEEPKVEVQECGAKISEEDSSVEKTEVVSDE